MELARRLGSSALLVALMLGAALPAAAEEAPAADPAPLPAVEPAPAPAPAPQVPRHRVRRVDVTRDITFPLVFPVQYGSSFGYCRDDCRREHHGVDIFTHGWKGVPVVAAEDGFVEKAEVYGTQEFCSIYVRATDGWETRYVHLNTDTPGTDDGEFHEGCSAPGVEPGVFVKRGQLLGWIGDSGNAEETRVHLHFEIRTPRGLPVDPYKSLRSADRIRFTVIDDADPTATAIEVSRLVYPAGATTVFVATPDPTAPDGVGLPWNAKLEGPLLLVEGGVLSQETRAELERLHPAVVVVLDRAGDPPALGDLEMYFRTFAMSVEHRQFPAPPEAPAAQIAGAVPAQSAALDPWFRTVLVQSGREVDASTEHAVAELGLPSVRLIQEGDLERRRGRSSLDGPGRSGRRGVLYYAIGDGWEWFPAEEPQRPYLGTVLVAGDRELTAATLTFLRSAARLDPMPLWR